MRKNQGKSDFDILACTLHTLLLINEFYFKLRSIFDFVFISILPPNAPITGVQNS